MSDGEVETLHRAVRHFRTVVDALEDDPQVTGLDASQSDPFSYWEGQLREDAPETRAGRRLLGDAYPDDPRASAALHQSSDLFLVFSFQDDYTKLINDVAELSEGPVQMTRARTKRWIHTFSVMRVALATELGIVDEQSCEELEALAESEGYSQMHYTYEWLGGMVELLIEIETGGRF